MSKFKDIGLCLTCTCWTLSLLCDHKHKKCYHKTIKVYINLNQKTLRAPLWITPIVLSIHTNVFFDLIVWNIILLVLLSVGTTYFMYVLHKNRLLWRWLILIGLIAGALFMYVYRLCWSIFYSNQSFAFCKLEFLNTKITV